MVSYLSHKLYGDLVEDLDKVLKVLKEDSAKLSILEKQLEVHKLERDKFKNMVVAIGNTIPNLMWAKSTDGKYLYANRTTLDTLFYGVDKIAVLGKDDAELATEARKLVGAENHTFGEVCGNSDVIVLEQLGKGRFLEYGKVNSKDLYLEVYKAPFYNDEGELLGTVGTGRDVTEWYLGVRGAIEAMKTCGNSACKDAVLGELDKYKFEG